MGMIPRWSSIRNRGFLPAHWLSAASRSDKPNINVQLIASGLLVDGCRSVSPAQNLASIISHSVPNRKVAEQTGPTPSCRVM